MGGGGLLHLWGWITTPMGGGLLHLWEVDYYTYGGWITTPISHESIAIISFDEGLNALKVI